MQKRKFSSRTPAKSFSDIEISEDSWKPDFDMVEKYQGFATELIRISLLGIAGYGFLISEVVMKQFDKFCNLVSALTNYFMIGAGMLGLSLALALAHRFFSTDCLYYQILIFRSLKRLDNAHWSEEEKKRERGYLEIARDKQRSTAWKSNIILICSTISFAIGFLFL